MEKCSKQEKYIVRGYKHCNYHADIFDETRGKTSQVFTDHSLAAYLHCGYVLGRWDVWKHIIPISVCVEWWALCGWLSYWIQEFKLKCPGGGRIEHDPQAKKIFVYGHSVVRCLPSTVCIHSSFFLTNELLVKSDVCEPIKRSEFRVSANQTTEFQSKFWRRSMRIMILLGRMMDIEGPFQHHKLHLVSCILWIEVRFPFQIILTVIYQLSFCGQFVTSAVFSTLLSLLDSLHIWLIFVIIDDSLLKTYILYRLFLNKEGDVCHCRIGTSHERNSKIDVR